MEKSPAPATAPTAVQPGESAADWVREAPAARARTAGIAASYTDQTQMRGEHFDSTDVT